MIFEVENCDYMSEKSLNRSMYITNVSYRPLSKLTMIFHLQFFIKGAEFQSLKKYKKANATNSQRETMKVSQNLTLFTIKIQLHCINAHIGSKQIWLLRLTTRESVNKTSV
ncbi:hypothetical protein R5R35_007286 [Gryllus longicercus]|uniref:Uncharacterized protein n=1 Tax=Gryllus longicercus TaxID=2509291 RepID=A0AAN9V6V1_9ORTH